MRRTVVRLGQQLFHDVGNPAVTSRSVVLVLRIQLLEELRDVHAGAVRKVLSLVFVLRVVAANVAHYEGAEGFDVAALELHGCHCRKVYRQSWTSADTLVSRPVGCAPV